MNNKKAFFLLLIFTVFLSNAFGQSDLKLPESANSLEGFVPKGWKIADKLEGDLDADGNIETVLVLQSTDQTLIKKSEYLDYNVMIRDEKSGDLKMMMDDNPVILAILSKQKDGYKLTAQNNQVIPRFMDDWYRWKHSVSLENKTLKVEIFGKVSMAISDNFGETKRVYKFQMIDAKLVLTEAEETYWFNAMLARNGRKDRYEKHDFIKNTGFIVSTMSIDKQPAKEETHKIGNLISFETLSADSMSKLKSLANVQLNTISTQESRRAFDKLIFRFKDASISPESRRNYAITVTKEKAGLVVESNKVLTNLTVSLKSNDFDELVKIFNDAKIINRKEADDDGCSGGTTNTFETFQADKPVLSGFVYACGGETFGNLEGDYRQVKNKLKSLFPDFKKLLKTEKNWAEY